MELVWYFLAGFFAGNGLPHIVKGITGQTHMTPFAKVSSPVLNVLWGFFNALVAMYILGMASGRGGLVAPWDASLAGTNLIVFLAGVIVVGVYLASFWSNPKAKLPWQ